MTDTRALYAIHGENTLDYDGWIVRTFGIGHDPSHAGGVDLLDLIEAGTDSVLFGAQVCRAAA